MQNPWIIRDCGVFRVISATLTYPRSIRSFDKPNFMMLSTTKARKKLFPSHLVTSPNPASCQFSSSVLSFQRLGSCATSVSVPVPTNEFDKLEGFHFSKDGCAILAWEVPGDRCQDSRCLMDTVVLRVLNSSSAYQSYLYFTSLLTITSYLYTQKVYTWLWDEITRTESTLRASCI